jgi:hypothetical protein
MVLSFIATRYRDREAVSAVLLATRCHLDRRVSPGPRNQLVAARIEAARQFRAAVRDDVLPDEIDWRSIAADIDNGVPEASVESLPVSGARQVEIGCADNARRIRVLPGDLGRQWRGQKRGEDEDKIAGHDGLPDDVA